MGPLPGLRQHGIPPFSAHHLGTNPIAPEDGPLQEVPEAFSLSQEIEPSGLARLSASAMAEVVRSQKEWRASRFPAAVQ